MCWAAALAREPVLLVTTSLPARWLAGQRAVGHCTRRARRITRAFTTPSAVSFNTDPSAIAAVGTVGCKAGVAAVPVTTSTSQNEAELPVS